MLRSAMRCLPALVLLTACGGGSHSTTSATDLAPAASAATATASPTTGTARRLTECPGGDAPRSFARIAPTGTLPSFPSADAAVADFVKEMSASSYQLIGPDPKGTRYSVVSPDGEVTEVIVAEQPHGWAVTETIGC